MEAWGEGLKQLHLAIINLLIIDLACTNPLPHCQFEFKVTTNISTGMFSSVIKISEAIVTS